MRRVRLEQVGGAVLVLAQLLLVLAVALVNLVEPCLLQGADAHGAVLPVEFELETQPPRSQHAFHERLVIRRGLEASEEAKAAYKFSLLFTAAPLLLSKSTQRKEEIETIEI